MLWIELDRAQDLPTIQQIYMGIRKQILTGQLQAGERLPSSRELAETLNVARSVVLEAYDQLTAEGYLKSKQGAGTFVETNTLLEGCPLAIEKETPPIKHYLPKNQNRSVIDYRSGIPALDLFPRKKWLHVAKEVYEDIDPSLFGYSFPEGSEELRYTLTNYLFKTRGISCDPDQIVITSGATQGFTILAKLLLGTRNRVIMEDPVTKEIPDIFIEKGANIYPVSVDEFGMRTELLPLGEKPSFTFVTPSHQYPLGGILPIQRRIQLINYAKKTNSYIVEDDYDSEFRYSGPPVSSIQGLAPEKVLYLGTFSKILSPSLRIGYLIVPKPLVRGVKNVKRYTDYHSPTIEQIILARFIQKGYLDKHITKMRKVYKVRKETLIPLLKKYFGDQVTITGTSTGLHFVVQFIGIEFTPTIVERLNNMGVNIYPVENHAIVKGLHKDKLIFGYGNLTEEEMEVGIVRLKEAIINLEKN